MRKLPIRGRNARNYRHNRRRGFYISPPDLADYSQIGRDEGAIEPTATPQPTSRREVYTLTAYCHCAKCCGKSNGITASGAKAVEGVTIAADTRKLPFGTRVVINGHTYIVQDRGGAIKGNRIDIYFSTHEKALKFGRQTKDIIILNK